MEINLLHNIYLFIRDKSLAIKDSSTGQRQTIPCWERYLDGYWSPSARYLWMKLLFLDAIPFGF